MNWKANLPYLIALFLLLLQAWYGDGRDHYQLLYALQAELAGDNAYGTVTFERVAAKYREPGAQQCLPCAEAGFAYPLTAIWIALPVVWLPEAWWSTAWEIMTIALVLPALVLLRLSPLWVIWWGFMNAMLSNNLSNILIALALIAIWAVRQRHYPLASLLVVLLLATKPQTVGLFGLALAWQLWQQRQWRWLVGLSALIGGATFAVQPDWIIVWLQSVREFAGALPTVWHAPWALPLAAYAVWRGMGWTALGLGHLIVPLVPASYTMLPLMISGAELAERRQTLAITISTTCAVIAPSHLDAVILAATFLAIVFWLPKQEIAYAQPSQA